MRGALFVCFAAVLWGFDGVVLTPRLFALPVAFVVFLIHITPFLLMQPFLYRSYKILWKLPRREWLFIALLATCGGVVGTLALVKALFLLNFNQLSVVGLLQKLQPLFAITLSAIFLKERISKEFVLWSSLAVIGAYFLTFGLSLPSFSTGNTTMAAAGLALLAAMAFGSATVLSKRVLQKLDFASASFARIGITALFAALLVPFLGGMQFSAVTNTHWGLILVIALTTGTTSLLLYYYGLQSIRASTATICELCLPLSLVVFDYFINGNMLSFWQFIGVGLMLGAILRITVSPLPHGTHEQRPDNA